MGIIGLHNITDELTPKKQKMTVLAKTSFGIYLPKDSVKPLDSSMGI